MSLRISTTCAQAIQLVVGSAKRQKSCGWRCADGDILKQINDLVCARTAAIELRLTKVARNSGKQGCSHLQHAIRMARIALMLPPNANDSPLSNTSNTSTSSALLRSEITGPKVFASGIGFEGDSMQILDPDMTKEKSKVPRRESGREKHKGRKRQRAIKERNRRRLMEAKTPRQWWKVVDELSGAQPEPVSVTASSL